MIFGSRGVSRAKYARKVGENGSKDSQGSNLKLSVWTPNNKFRSTSCGNAISVHSSTTVVRLNVIVVLGVVV